MTTRKRATVSEVVGVEVAVGFELDPKTKRPVVIRLIGGTSLEQAVQMLRKKCPGIRYVVSKDAIWAKDAEAEYREHYNLACDYCGAPIKRKTEPHVFARIRDRNEGKTYEIQQRYHRACFKEYVAWSRRDEPKGRVILPEDVGALS